MGKTDGRNSRRPLNECDAALVSAMHRLTADEGAAEVRAAIESGASAWNRDSEWNTIMHSAAACNNQEVVKFLCDRGMVTSSENCEGDTPLHFAARRNHGDMVSTLLDLGSNIAVENAMGETPLHCALRTASTESVKRLIYRGAMVDATIGEGIIDEAARVDPAEAGRTKAILRAAAQVERDQKIAKSFPLRFDGRSIKVQLASAVTAQTKFDEEQNLVDTLHSNPSGTDKFKCFEFIKKWLHRYQLLHFIELTARHDEHGDLWRAVTQNEEMEVKRLLNQHSGNEAFINLIDSTPGQRTPLWAALILGHLNIARMLLDSGAEMEATLEDGKSMLLFFAYNWDIVKMLIEHGADMNVRDLHGNTFQHLAVLGGENRIIASLYVAPPDPAQDEDERMATGESLSKLANNRGDTLLHTAAIYGQIDAIATLVGLHINIDAVNKSGDTPVLLAAQYGNLEAVESLLGKGASHHGKNKFNDTLRHCTNNAKIRSVIHGEIARRKILGI
jgi:ankyrin repeat protein